MNELDATLGVVVGAHLTTQSSSLPIFRRVKTIDLISGTRGVVVRVLESQCRCRGLQSLTVEKTVIYLSVHLYKMINNIN